MSEIQYKSSDQVEVGMISITVEQRIRASSQFDGLDPSLSTEPAGERDFVPFFDTDDGVFRLKNPGPTTPAGTIAEGNHGGLFSFSHTQPCGVMQFLADLGSSITWTLQLVLKDGKTIVLHTDTGRYITLIPYGEHRLIINPTEKVQLITTAATAAMWARMYVRLEQPQGL